MILLTPNDKLRYVLNVSKTEWSEDEALSKAFLKFHIWDVADNRSSGHHVITLGNDKDVCDRYPLSICCHSQFLVQIPIGGCDKKPGSLLKNNTCNNCSRVENNIYKKCNDCHAVIGNALMLH